MNAILREVYGIDIFNPPAGCTRGAIIADKGLWESRTHKEWCQIKKRYEVTDVLTHTDYRLRLPLVSRSGEYALYRIP